MMPAHRIHLLAKLALAAAPFLFLGAIVHDEMARRQRMVARTHARVRMHDLQEVLVHYGVDHAEQCPRSMRVLIDRGYLARPLLDVWGTELAFTCTSPFSTDEALVVSAGPDRTFDTPDDVRSDR